MTPSSLRGGRYTVLGVLGHGGMGTVLHCHDERNDIRVAVKELIPPSGRARTERIGQFREEAALLSTLSHPAIPRAHGVFEDGGRHYLVMERIPGKTLRSWVEQNGRPATRQSVQWLERLLDVLGFLHGQKPPVVFRDLTPDNVMVSDDSLKLVDFGLARRLTPDAPSRPSLDGWGSPGFAAPEHYAGQGAGAAADLYGVAALAHWLLCGEPPLDATRRLVEGDDGHAALDGHARPALSAWVRRGLALDPADRHASAEAMRNVLLEAARDNAPRPTPVDHPARFLDALQGRLSDHEWHFERREIKPFALFTLRRFDLRVFHGLCWICDVVDDVAVSAAAEAARALVTARAGLLASVSFCIVAGDRVVSPEAVQAAAHAASDEGLRALMMLPVDLQAGKALDRHVPATFRSDGDPADLLRNIRLAISSAVGPRRDSAASSAPDPA
ncbi:MAG: serine/threonine protein kinase [Proteobacteria bacterium]|nr:serine/threonine protein kinase [Pseudomonadota bacterium]